MTLMIQIVEIITNSDFIMNIKQAGTCKMWMKKGIGVVKNVLNGEDGNPTLVQELIKIE